MSTYENAPATKMLATHCCLCRRPLLDAKSVEIGVGPECRKKHGYDEAVVSEEARTRANVMLHELAADQRTPNLLAYLAELRLLGLTRLCDVLQGRLAAVSITEANGALEVVSHYNESFVVLIRNVPGRRWVPERKCNTVPTTSKQSLWKVLSECYPGALGIGPRGPFIIPS